MNSCWNSIGVRGDGSCTELAKFVHCRNCPVHAEAALTLLERAPAADYLASWTNYVSKAAAAAERDAQSVVIFRVQAEWLALPTSAVQEVTQTLRIHSLPHRRRDLVLGLVNVRGELTVCVALDRILGLEQGAESSLPANRAERQRFLVIQSHAVRVVCPVQEVHGTHRCAPRELTAVPATLARATTSHSRTMLSWRGHSVGMLDEQLLLTTLKRILG